MKKIKVTKVTVVTGQQSVSYFSNPDVDKRTYTLNAAWEDTRKLAERLGKIAQLISFISDPNMEFAQEGNESFENYVTITAAINSMLFKENIIVKKVSKTKAQYEIPNLYIHTETIED